MGLSSPATSPFEVALDPGRDITRSGTDVHADVLALFDSCGPALRRYVRSCGLTPEEAEDVVQDAFVALFRHLRNGGNTDNLRGWLVQVCYRLGLKQRQRSARRQQCEARSTMPGADRPTDPTESVETQLIARQHRRRLQSVVKAMSEKDRQCLLLRAEGLRYRAIARTLGISLGAVAKSLAYSIARLGNAGER